MPTPADPIETRRLTLRSFNPGDLDDLYAYQSRPEVARFLRWDARDHAQAREALEEQCRETHLGAEGDWLTFAVVWREIGRVVGETGLKLVSRQDREGETGFVFNPGYRARAWPPRPPQPYSRWPSKASAGTGSPAAVTLGTMTRHD